MGSTGDELLLPHLALVFLFICFIFFWFLGGWPSALIYLFTCLVLLEYVNGSIFTSPVTTSPSYLKKLHMDLEIERRANGEGEKSLGENNVHLMTYGWE